MLAGNNHLVQALEHVIVSLASFEQRPGAELNHFGLIGDRVGPHDFGTIGIGIHRELIVDQQVLHRHAGAVFVGSRAFHGPDKTHHIGNLRRENADAHIVPVEQNRIASCHTGPAFFMPLRRQRADQIHIHHDPATFRIKPEQMAPLPVRKRREASGESQEFCQTHPGFHFVDRRALDRSADRHHRTERRNQHDVSRLQALIETPVSPQQKIIQVQFRDSLSLAHHLDLAQRSRTGRAAGSIERIRRGGQRTDFVGARADDFAHDIHFDRPDPCHRHVQFESLQKIAQSGPHGLLDLRKSLAADRNRSHLRDHDHPVTFDRHDEASIEAGVGDIPNVHGKRVLRPDDEIRPDRDILDRREGIGLRFEKVVAELSHTALHAVQHRKLGKGFFHIEILLTEQFSGKGLLFGQGTHPTR